MINKLIKLIIFSFLILIQENIYGHENFGELPKETAVLKFASDPYSDWKELTRLVSENEGILECIPKDQEVYNWSKLIVIQYIGNEHLLRINLTNCLKNIKEQMVASKQPNELVWNEIQKNENDAIYEWILYDRENKSVLEHEICRAFLNKHGFYRVGYNQKNEKVNDDEKEKWIKNFQESAEVVSFQDAKKYMGLSLANNQKIEFDLGSAFKNWRQVSLQTTLQGSSFFTFIPVSSKRKNVYSEYLEINKIPNFENISAAVILKENNLLLQSEGIKMNFLKKSATQNFFYILEPGKVKNSIAFIMANVFVKDNFIYYFSYKCKANKKYKKKDLLKWQIPLEQIKPNI